VKYFTHLIIYFTEKKNYNVIYIYIYIYTHRLIMNIFKLLVYLLLNFLFITYVSHILFTKMRSNFATRETSGLCFKTRFYQLEYHFILIIYRILNKDSRQESNFIPLQKYIFAWDMIRKFGGPAAISLHADFTSLHSNELWASSVCNRKSRFTNFWLYHYRSASRGRSVATSFIVAVFTKYTNPCNFVSEPVRLEIHAISGDWYVLAHA